MQGGRRRRVRRRTKTSPSRGAPGGPPREIRRKRSRAGRLRLPKQDCVGWDAPARARDVSAPAPSPHPPHLPRLRPRARKFLPRLFPRADFCKIGKWHASHPRKSRCAIMSDGVSTSVSQVCQSLTGGRGVARGSAWRLHWAPRRRACPTACICVSDERFRAQAAARPAAAAAAASAAALARAIGGRPSGGRGRRATSRTACLFPLSPLLLPRPLPSTSAPPAPAGSGA